METSIKKDSKKKARIVLFGLTFTWLEQYALELKLYASCRPYATYLFVFNVYIE